MGSSLLAVVLLLSVVLSPRAETAAQLAHLKTLRLPAGFSATYFAAETPYAHIVKFAQ